MAFISPSSDSAGETGAVAPNRTAPPLTLLFVTAPNNPSFRNCNSVPNPPGAGPGPGSGGGALLGIVADIVTDDPVSASAIFGPATSVFPALSVARLSVPAASHVPLVAAQNASGSESAGNPVTAVATAHPLQITPGDPAAAIPTVIAPAGLT
jgi:hypothetical protein